MSRVKLIVVGGVAAGASFAARARRLNEQAEITIFERGPDVSFANCGLPYHIGGEIPVRDVLAVQTPASLKAMLELDVRTNTEVIKIDPVQKRVLVRNLVNKEEVWHTYDKLMLSPGAVPIMPPLPGIGDARIHALRNLSDMDHIKNIAKQAKRAVVVGAGFIGLEMAEQLKHQGVDVHLVELQPHVLPQLDEKMSMLIETELRLKHVKLHIGMQVVGFESEQNALKVLLNSGESIETDLVIMSIGVKPENKLAKEAGLKLGEKGHIVVNGFMQTSDPNIYAAGDVIETADRILPAKINVPLGGPANRQGRVAADHVMLGEKARPYPGSLGTAIVRVFDVAVGMTGWSEKRLKQAGVEYDTVTVNDYQHAPYFPGAMALTLKICWEKATGRLLGAQATGHEGVDKRLDVLATAISAKMNVEDLCHLELAYAPPFGSAKDAINLAGFSATNMRDGLVNRVEELPTDPSMQLIDVRPKPLADLHPVAGAVNIPFMALRQNMSKIDKTKPVVTLCAFGKMSYFAARVLMQNDYDVGSYSGGIKANIDVRMPSKL